MKVILSNKMQPITNQQLFILKHFFFYLYSCVWIFVTFITLYLMYSIYPCPAGTTRGEYFIVVVFLLCLPFVLLRQKGRVFYFRQECIFKTDQVIFVPEWPNEEFVSLC
jgi:hypothetical protein